MIKPYHILIVFTSIIGGLLLAMFFLPKSIQIGGLTFNFTQVDDYVPEVIYEVTNEYSSKKSGTDLAEVSFKELNVDSLYTDSTLSEKQFIIHPSDFENSLYTFYTKLQNLEAEKDVVRIVHFGDSQIEGDRISGVLRENLQSVFGGCGSGFMPITQNDFGRLAVNKEAAGFEKHQISGGNSNNSHKDYGFLGYYHRINPELHKATLKLSQGSRKFDQSKSQSFENIKLLMGNINHPITITLRSDTGNIEISNFEDEENITLKSWDYTGSLKNTLQLEFVSDHSPDIFGVAMDCATGVNVDNVPFRGKSGVEFSKVNKKALVNQFAQLNVGLVIYQFGINVVPHIVNNYSYYQRMMERELKLIKEILPEASILVIGVSDMARKVGEDYESYPNIHKIRKVQMEAAKNTNCAFWDLHQVMGGENAIINWVNANPPLAQKDYVHFNTRGANWVGEKIFQAIHQDFKDYQSLNIQ